MTKDVGSGHRNPQREWDVLLLWAFLGLLGLVTLKGLFGVYEWQASFQEDSVVTRVNESGVTVSGDPQGFAARNFCSRDERGRSEPASVRANSPGRPQRRV